MDSVSSNPGGAQLGLVAQVSAALRDMVFARKPDEFIGSLHDLARQLGVGIVTFQQAARVLEHEGLLQVRRGPGGGYYGVRPNEEAVERAIGAYLRAHPSSLDEALNLTSVLFTEIATAAATCADGALRAELAALSQTMDGCGDEKAWNAFESEFQDILFRMVNWPLFELLSHVTMSITSTRIGGRPSGLRDNLESWKDGRRKIIAAILDSDADLARFEANRGNRLLVLKAIQSS